MNREILDGAAVEDILDIIICRLYGKNNGMEAGARELLESYYSGGQIPVEYVIIDT